MKLITINDQQGFTSEIKKITKRSSEKLKDVTQAVAEIIDRVKREGDKALFDYARQFDGADLSSLRVTQEEIQKAYDECDPAFLAVLKEARDNIAAYHEKQRYAPIEIREEGRFLSQRVTPIERAGLYVPGGKSPYPSTVLMDSVPAFVAGVKEIAMITPAGADGSVNPNILAAAKVCGITEIYKSGGAQAIAALAYGTESIKPVYKICGPGNLYVTAAKRMVYGDVDIDMLAGPSEVLIVADKSANPVYVAADLLSQAEHDEAAACVLVTDCKELAETVREEVERQLKTLEKESIARKSVENYGTIFVTKDLKTAFDIANEIAPEHLELALENAEDTLPLVKNAGTIFVGEYTPEPVGDYFAGTNHTIPTSGTAKFYSPLSSYDFMKRTSIVRYEREALKQIKDKVIAFAQKEGLTAHANSIRKRFPDE